ncbi:type VI secretion system Vgr family domain protein [Escherichia coli]|nr:type VI secretion system Vgr family domain protein [Escherichia coli]
MSTGLRFTLEVDGLPPDAFAVVSFHLNQSLSSLFSLDLSLVSQQFLSLEFAQVNSECLNILEPKLRY